MSIIIRAGKVLAIVFHPVFLFFYLVIVLVAVDKHCSENWVVLILTAFLFTVLAPIIFTLFNQKNLFLPNKKQRFFPLLFGSVCYFFTLWLLQGFYLPDYLGFFLISIALSSFILSFISLFWKISMHANGLGSVSGLIFSQMQSNIFYYSLIALWALFVLIILTQRIVSKSHTIIEVIAGFVMGMAITLAFSSFKDSRP